MNDFYVVSKKPNGKKIVSIKCNTCHKRYEVQLQQYHKERFYYCRSCSSSGDKNGMYKKGYLLKGELNGNYGGLSESHRKNISISRTGIKVNLTKEQKEKRRIIGGNNLRKWMKENPELHKEKSRIGGINSLKLQSDYGRISSIEQKTINWLNQNDVNYIFQFSLNNKFLYDFKIDDILIEVNGTWFHNLPEQIEKDKNKKLLAENNGYKVIYLWEDEVNNNDFSKLEEII